MGSQDNTEYQSALEAAAQQPDDQGTVDPNELYGGTGALSAAQQAEVGQQASALDASAASDNETALTQQQKVAQGAREALRAARDRLTNEKPDHSSMWLAVAQAMGAPSPGFATSLTQGFGAAAPYKEDERRERLNRLTDIDKISTQLSEYGSDPKAFSTDMIQSRLNNARLKEIEANALRVAALRHTGSNPTAGQPELAKLIAIRDSLDPSDPNRKLYDDKIKLLTTRAPNSFTMMTPANNALAGALFEAGIPTIGLSGARGIAILDGIRKRHPGESDDQIAEGIRTQKVGYSGDLAAARSVGTVVGKVAYAENELRATIPLARASSARLPRNLWVTPQKLLQMGQAQIQSPALRDLQIKVRSLQNAYELLASRSGNDVGKRAELHEMIMTADSPQVFETALKAFEQEGKVAGAAGRKAMKDVATRSDSGDTADAGPAPRTKEKNGQTWVLHSDAKGRKAYVSPDGTQFEAVQ